MDRKLPKLAKWKETGARSVLILENRDMALSNHVVILEAAEKAAYEVYNELGAKSAHWKRIYPEWKKFRDEQFLWFRVAESTYDNYIFNSKLGAS